MKISRVIVLVFLAVIVTIDAGASMMRESMMRICNQTITLWGHVKTCTDTEIQHRYFCQELVKAIQQEVAEGVILHRSAWSWSRLWALALYSLMIQRPALGVPQDIVAFLECATSAETLRFLQYEPLICLFMARDDDFAETLDNKVFDEFDRHCLPGILARQMYREANVLSDDDLIGLVRHPEQYELRELIEYSMVGYIQRARLSSQSHRDEAYRLYHDLRELFDRHINPLYSFGSYFTASHQTDHAVIYSAVIKAYIAIVEHSNDYQSVKNLIQAIVESGDLLFIEQIIDQEELVVFLLKQKICDVGLFSPCIYQHDVDARTKAQLCVILFNRLHHQGCEVKSLGGESINQEPKIFDSFMNMCCLPSGEHS